jgi:tetratricopeptide (TPR) repeat protein
MQALKHRLGKVVLLVACLWGIWIYSARVARTYFAEKALRSDDSVRVKRASDLLPGNAEIPHAIGLQLLLANENSGDAIAYLRRAAVTNPNSARYWFDLASAYQVDGNVQGETTALQAAINAEPNDPDTLVEAGMHELVSADPTHAFRMFRRALQSGSRTASAILPACWRATGDARLILSQVLPANPALQLEFLRFLAERNETKAAAEAWDVLLGAKSSRFEPQLGFFYLDYLVREHDPRGFERAWRRLAGTSSSLMPYLPSDNLIVNGGFELPMLNAGLDWRHEAAPDVEVGIDSREAHAGSHSLYLSYNGSPVYDAGWHELVPVQPNTHYAFSAWVKSENITSSSGPRLAIVDAYSGANLLLSGDVLDSHDWYQITGELRVPSETEMASVKFIRAPANTGIRGKLWVDDLKLLKK